MSAEPKPPPVKLYYRIGEVSEIVGVEPHVLRYWETEFRTIRPQKSRKGQRIYSRRDVDKLLRVKDLLYTQGYTIAGARKRLRDASSAEAPVEGAPGLAPSSAPPASAGVAQVAPPNVAPLNGAAPGAPAPAVDAATAALQGLRSEVADMLRELESEH